MSVSVWVGEKSFAIGSSSFLNAWFSTIVVHLEGGKRGSVFPVMAALYEGGLVHARAAEALEELERVRQALEKFPPALVVWDSENRRAKPPWGDKISPVITSLGNYFVTSDGKDLFGVLAKAFEEALATKRDLEIM